MSERVLISGGASTQLLALFEARGLAAAGIARPPSPSDLPGLRVLVLAPSESEAETLAPQVATLLPLAEAAGCLLGGLLPLSWARAGYGLLRAGLHDFSTDPDDLCERLLARLQAAPKPGMGRAPSVRPALLPPRPAPLRAKSARRPRAKPLVLVVEDDVVEREGLVELLEPYFEVLFAADGEEGARLARERTPDLVLLDLMMPRVDGFSAMEKLRRSPRTAGIPAIVISGQPDEVVRIRALELGAADYVSKPFSGRELVTRIERTVRMQREREALFALAQTDALTSLPNFRAFKMRLDAEFKRSHRYRLPLACVMVDLDNLKGINDQHGHAMGNRAIALIAESLKAELRATDFAARYGGDEFVLLLPHTNEAEAAVFADRVRRRFAGTRLESAGVGIQLRASLGVAAATGAEGESAEGLLGRADAALYAAKAAGRARVVLASSLSQAERAPA